MRYNTAVNGYLRNAFNKVQSWVLPISDRQRSEIARGIAADATPQFDFFLLTVLSGSIATLGLVTNSAAVIIGAMLLAPLMSPIIGIGLASINGDTTLLRSSINALLRGVLLAIGLSFIITLFNRFLPFISLRELPNEVLARTRPSPIDLLIALAGGIAAAYALTNPKLSAALPGVAIATALMPPLCTIGIGLALTNWVVAGGAMLLFITNAITIAFAGAVVFFLRGFAGRNANDNERSIRSLRNSAILVLALLIALTYISVDFFIKAAENRRINDVVSQEVRKLPSAELVEMHLLRNGENINMELTLRTNAYLSYQEVVELQSAIVSGINMPVSLKVNQMLAERLDPLIPPTSTTTPTITHTNTPGPSLTPTITPTFTQTFTPRPSLTPSQPPSATPTLTASPAGGKAWVATLPALQLYQSPGGPVIGKIGLNQVLLVYDQRQVFNGLTWVFVADAEGRLGWIPEVYLQVFTPTFTPSASPTPTLEDPG